MMTADEILAALRAMRDDYSIPSRPSECNYPGMERDDLARHMAEDAANEEMRETIFGDLDGLISRIVGNNPDEIDDPYVGDRR